MVNSGAIIRLPGITLYGDRFRGKGCHFTDMVGWTSMPEVVSEGVSFEFDDGEFDEAGYMPAREVRVPGFYAGGTHREVVQTEQRFKSLRRQRQFVVAVEEPSRTLYGNARLMSLAYDSSGFHPDAPFEVVLRFSDPRRYGNTNVTPPGTSVVPMHRGDADAQTVFVITGAMSGYKLVGPADQEYVVTEPLAAGKTDRIDMADGRLYRDGVMLIGKSRGSRWTTPPGIPTGSVTLVPTSGVGSLVGITLDTHS